MSASVDITFFIPCYNEEKNVVPAVQTVLKSMEGRSQSFEIIVGDDGSKDATSERLMEFKRAHPELPLRHFKNETNLGLGANYVKGAHMAAGTYYMMVCGDNDTPLNTMNFMIDHVGKADIINPYLESINKRPWGRRFFSKLFTWLVGTITGSHLRYYNGIVIHKTSSVKRFAPKATGFAYQAEILCEAVASGLTCLDVPVHTTAQAGFFNSSAFRPKNVISVLGSLWRMLWNRKYHSVPSRKKG